MLRDQIRKKPKGKKLVRKPTHMEKLLQELDAGDAARKKKLKRIKLLRSIA